MSKNQASCCKIFWASQWTTFGCWKSCPPGWYPFWVSEAFWVDAFFWKACCLCLCTLARTAPWPHFSWIHGPRHHAHSMELCLLVLVFQQLQPHKHQSPATQNCSASRTLVRYHVSHFGAGPQTTFQDFWCEPCSLWCPQHWALESFGCGFPQVAPKKSVCSRPGCISQTSALAGLIGTWKHLL